MPFKKYPIEVRKYSNVDREGYDKNGKYWGTGLPLFYYESINDFYYGYVRAKNITEAKKALRKMITDPQYPVK